MAIQSYGIAAYGIANNDCRGGVRAGSWISYYKDWIKTFINACKKNI